MKTDELISMLSADTLPRITVQQRLMRALPAAMLVSTLALIGAWGIRPDIAAALGSAAVLKHVLPLGLVALAGAVAVALVHPAMPVMRRMPVLGVFGAILFCVFALALSRQGLSGLTDALVTPSLLVCLLSIPVLATPFLVAALWALSAGAALRPHLAGAAAGLCAGGAGAAIYALYCDQDAILFVLPAYFAAILVVALIGALAGPRALKW